MSNWNGQARTRLLATAVLTLGLAAAAHAQQGGVSGAISGATPGVTPATPPAPGESRRLIAPGGGSIPTGGRPAGVAPGGLPTPGTPDSDITITTDQNGAPLGDSRITTGDGAVIPPPPPTAANTRLESGANSFTEAQARARLQDAGFVGVSGLRKDDNGIWRGTAVQNGRQIAVGLDYRGSIAAQ